MTDSSLNKEPFQDPAYDNDRDAKKVLQSDSAEEKTFLQTNPDPEPTHDSNTDTKQMLPSDSTDEKTFIQPNSQPINQQGDDTPTSPINPYMPNTSSAYSQPINQTEPPPSPPSWGTPASVQKLHRLAQPLPVWMVVGSMVLITAALVVLHATGSDWGDGAVHASQAALWIGVGLLLVLIVRGCVKNGLFSAHNPTRRRQVWLSLLCTTLIFIYSGVSAALVPTLHLTQGHRFEDQQQWETAIYEYKLAGESAPNGVNLARVYSSWGSTLNQKRHYTEAMAKFAVVIQQFQSNATKDQLARAQHGDVDARFALAKQSEQTNNYQNASSIYYRLLSLPYCDNACRNQAQNGDINAHLTLAQQKMQTKDYLNATQEYDGILDLPYCDSACNKKVSLLDAKAYYQQGKSQLAAQHYSDAVTTFDTILNKFIQAPEAQQLHGNLAKALLGEGQSELGSICSNAIPIYQRLAKDFGDTPEGQKAAQDLSAPQTVKGKFSNTEPTINFNQMALTHGLRGDMSDNELFAAWNSASMITAIQGDGSFVFDGVPQGDYDLMWSGISGYYQYFEFIYLKNPSSPKYVAHVGPLCPVNMGSVSNSHRSF
jgi:tetratricopeptide (TPR) repeat protein